MPEAKRRQNSLKIKYHEEFSYFFIVVIIAGIFTGCQKEEIIVQVDTDAIRAELLLLPVPTSDEIRAEMSGVSLKSAVYYRLK